MKVQRQKFGNALVLSLEGRLDHETTPEFREELMGSVRQAAGDELTLVLDLAKLDYLSSPGLNALIIASRTARKEAVNIHAAALQPMVRETWEISHLTLLVQTFPTVEEALQVVSLDAASAYAAAKASIKA
ncbi:MAG: STAS domain-containing protein [Burkholderiales bacterium]|nr:STAS domain-containing protein [Burkholderiales bacterium]